MSASSQGASGSASGNLNPTTRRTNTPPTRSSPQPSQTPPTTSRPTSAHKTQKQLSAGQLSAKAMNSAKSFESARSSRGSRDSLISRAPRTPEMPSLPNAKEELLKTLQTQFDSIRSIITCKICYGLLYEPYTTTCGHTYCYICFCKSFQPNQIPACPECRGKLPHPPAPAYAVREMTHAIIAFPESLPAGETVEDHKQWQKEHADFIQKDKENKNPRDGGLWRDFFRRRLPRPLPIRDWEDGVIRCPFCTWELEEGMCNRCGLPFDENGNGDWEFSDIASTHPSMMGGHDIVIEEDDYDREDDFIDDDEEGEGQEYDVYEDDGMGWEQPWTIQRMLGARVRAPQPPPARRIAAHSAAGGRSRYSASVHESEMGTLEEEDEDEEDEDSSMSGFVVDDREVNTFSREPTSASESPSSRWPESIAEDDEEEENDDDSPVAPGRRRTQHTQSSTPTVTAASQRQSQVRSQMPISQGGRRRRVISETPSTESTSSAPAEDEEDEGPIPAVNRRRRRGMSSSEEPVRRVRPRAQDSSNANEEETDSWGYRPLGTPQIGDGEDEQSDGARTEVGWEPLAHPVERIRNTGSLTPTADRPTAPPRPASRNSTSFPLGSRGIRRRSSVLSTVHYEDNDADDDGSDSQRVPQNATRPALQQRASRARLQNRTPQPAPTTTLAPSQVTDGEDTDNGGTEMPPHASIEGQSGRRRRGEYNPYISMVFAQHQTEVQTNDPEGPVYAEFEHLRDIARTPVARPRTANRNRINAATQPSTPNALLASPGIASRNLQNPLTPSRFRGASDMARTIASSHGVNNRLLTDRLPNSPRVSFSGPSQPATSSRFRNTADLYTAHPETANRQPSFNAVDQAFDQRTQFSNAQLLRTMNNPNSMTTAAVMQTPRLQTQFNPQPQSPRNVQSSEVIERPVSRVSTRGGYAIQRPPSTINRTPSNNNRPPSAGSRRGSVTRSPLAPPQIGPAGVGLNTARTWHPNNPFFHAVRPRQSNQRLRHEPSSQTLRPRPSTRVMRNQPPQAESPEPDQDSPQMRHSASRMHLRPQLSSRRLYVARDVNMAQYAQPIINPPPLRSSPGGSNTLSEDERSRRAQELVQRRMQELAQQRSSPAQLARQNQLAAAAQQRIQQRLASNMGGLSERQPASSLSQSTTVASTTSTVRQPSAPATHPQNNRPASTQQPSSFAPASATMNNSNTPTQQRVAREAAPARNHPPAMTQGVTAITAGGDIRRN